MDTQRKRNIQKDPETGQWVEIIGNQIRPISGPDPDQIAEARAYAQNVGPMEAAGMGMANAMGAGYWGKYLGVDPDQYQADMQALADRQGLSYGLGNVAAAVPAAIATGGMGIPAQIGAGAALGALGNAQDPLQGALLEGGAAGVGGLLGKAAGAFMRGGTTMAERVAGTIQRVKGAAADIPLPGYTPGILNMAPGRRTGSKILQNRVASRAAAGRGGGGVAADLAAEAAEAGQPKVLQGMLDPQEAIDKGIPLTQGDIMALSARDQGEYNAAKLARTGEELRRTDTFGLGRGIEDIRGTQKDYGTDFIKNILEVPGEVKLTREVVADTFTRLGDELDGFVDEIGSVDLGEQTLMALDDLVENAPLNYQSQLGKIRADVEKFAGADQMLDAKQWQQIRTRLNKMIESGKRQGDHAKISDAAEFQEALTAKMEGQLDPVRQEQLKQIRRQYAIAKTINKGATITPDGDINPATFYNNWRKGGGLKNVDDITRTFETIRFLDAKIKPSSGTAERIMANPIGTVGKVGVPTGLSMVGYDALFRD